MAAFDKIACGIPGLDEALDHIRLGDNVVWQLSKLEDFHYVVDPYVEQAIADGQDPRKGFPRNGASDRAPRFFLYRV